MTTLHGLTLEAERRGGEVYDTIHFRLRDGESAMWYQLDYLGMEIDQESGVIYLIVEPKMEQTSNGEYAMVPHEVSDH